jgi:ubiquinone/menaquinone biosynthesis C-methylase UbiE
MYKSEEDGIYGWEFDVTDQALERDFRKKVAASTQENLLDVVAQHHAIPVMDVEVVRFLRNIPDRGRILDVGGCWGWHWRNLRSQRPDVVVYIVDFVRENLKIARGMLGDLLDSQVFLVHGDGVDLRFPSESFDGYWSVQTLQHIPQFERAIREARRVLRVGGHFANYSLNNNIIGRILARIRKRPYEPAGWVEGAYWRAMACTQQRRLVETIMGSEVVERWTEILFTPEIGFTRLGRERSLLGRVDARLSDLGRITRPFARQHSFHCQRASIDI